MQRQLHHVVITTVLLCLLVAGCAGSRTGRQKQATAPAREGPRDNLQERAQAHAHYAAGVIHDLNARPEAARDEFFIAARKDPGSEPLVLEVSRRLLQAKQSERALELLTRAAELPGASANVYAWLGVAYFQAGKTNQAVLANRTAISKAPTSLLGYQNLFIAFTQAHDDEQAFAILEEALRQSGTSAEFLSGLADLYISHAIQVPKNRKQAHERALAALKSAAAQEPSQTILQLKIAETLAALGETEAAAKIWHQVLKSSPEVPSLREQVHARLADIYLRSTDKQRAVEQLEAIVREDPTNPQAYYFLGSLALEAHQLDAAADHLSKALILSPDLEQAYYDLASAQIGQTKSSEALTTLGQARDRFGQNFVLELLSGLACVQQKGYAEAVQHFTAAEVIARAAEPKRLTQAFYFQFGAAYERKGDYAQAETYFRKCLDLDPEFPEAQNYLGYMLAEQGTNLDEAKKLIEKAVAAQPTNAAYLDSLGWVLFKQGELEEALEKTAAAVKLLDEPDPTVYDHLGDIHHAMNQPEEAREAWRKSNEIEPNDKVRKKLEAELPMLEPLPDKQREPG